MTWTWSGTAPRKWPLTGSSSCSRWKTASSLWMHLWPSTKPQSRWGREVLLLRLLAKLLLWTPIFLDNSVLNSSVITEPVSSKSSREKHSRSRRIIAYLRNQRVIGWKVAERTSVFLSFKYVAWTTTRERRAIQFVLGSCSERPAWVRWSPGLFLMLLGPSPRPALSSSEHDWPLLHSQVCSVLESLEQEYKREEDWCGGADKLGPNSETDHVTPMISKHLEQKEAFLKVWSWPFGCWGLPEQGTWRGFTWRWLGLDCQKTADVAVCQAYVATLACQAGPWRLQLFPCVERECGDIASVLGYLVRQSLKIFHLWFTYTL